MDPRALYGEVILGADVVVGEAGVFGCPKESRLRAARTGQSESGCSVRLGDRCLIFNAVILYEAVILYGGVQLGADCVVEDRVRVGYDTTVGARSRLLYGAYIFHGGLLFEPTPRG